MSIPLCVQCENKPAIELTQCSDRYAGIVAFCSVLCATDYALSMHRGSTKKWCYRCEHWLLFRGGQCPQCGLSQSESAGPMRRRRQ